MTTELIIHLEVADGEVVWWAESPDLPGFTAAGSSLSELRELATAAIEEIRGGPVQIVEHLEAETSDAVTPRVAVAELVA
jgi:predicted RNase H-like HicB family nuclease